MQKITRHFARFILNISLPLLLAVIIWSGATCLPAYAQGPVVVNDVYTTTEDIPLNVTAPGVLTNDIGSPIISLETSPGAGTLLFNTDGSFVYTPTTNFNGQDEFIYPTERGFDS